jgi:cysteinyl-tRNA synthetase
VAVLFDLARQVNQGRDENRNVAEVQKTLRELAGILGFKLEEPPEGPLDDKMMAMIQRRNELRAAKKWLEADEMRARLAEAGISIEDTSSGTSWKRKN